MVSLFIEEENVKLYVPLALEGELQAVFHLRGQRKPSHCHIAARNGGNSLSYFIRKMFYIVSINFRMHAF